MRKLMTLCAMLIAVPAVASTPTTKTSTTPAGKPRFEASQKETAEATVLSVNKSKRTVKIVTAAGDTLSIECGQQVKNFDQIHAKDTVHVSYTEKLTIEVEGPGETGAAAEVSTSSAKAGEKPKAGVSGTVKVKATITAIDKEKGTVTLKDADGNEETMTPRNRANLDKVKVGDMVVFTYTQALAVSVAKTTAK